MRSILAGLRQLVIPWGAGSGADRIEMGGTLPADLVAFYATSNITLIGGTVYFHAPDEYAYSVLGIASATNTLRWHNGVRNTQGITDAMTITPFTLSRQAFIEFGFKSGDVVNLIVSNANSLLHIDDAAELQVTGTNTLMTIGLGAQLIINSTADDTLIDNVTRFDGGSQTDVGGDFDFEASSSLAGAAGADFSWVDMRHVKDEQNTASTTSSTTYANLTNIAGVAFTAPPSGIVTILFQAQLSNNNAGGGAGLTPWIGTGSTVGSGTQILAANDNNALAWTQHATAGEGLKFGGMYTATSLTPGTVYNVSMRGRAVTAGTATFDNIHTTVIPSP